jgi:hypothetical protein
MRIPATVYTNPDSNSLNKAAKDQINKTIKRFVGLMYFNAEAGSNGVESDIFWFWLAPGSVTKASALVFVWASYSPEDNLDMHRTMEQNSEELAEMLNDDLRENTDVTRELVIDARCIHDDSPGFVRTIVAPNIPIPASD